MSTTEIKKRSLMLTDDERTLTFYAWEIAAESCLAKARDAATDQKEALKFLDEAARLKILLLKHAE